MFPLRDSTPSRTFPFVNYLLIAVNALVFLLQLSAPDFEQFVLTYGFVPARFSFADLEAWKNVFYSIFMHGGFFHIASNMWFLHIFGDNVEDEIGHIRYFFFFVLAGVAAIFAQYILSVDSIIPMIGASGSVSGVIGAYFAVFKKAKIEALVPSYFGFFHRINLPAWFFLGYWFVIQVVSGAGSLAYMNKDTGGVAYFAHIGGFMFGYLVAKIFLKDSGEEY